MTKWKEEERSGWSRKGEKKTEWYGVKMEKKAEKRKEKYGGVMKKWNINVYKTRESKVDGEAAFKERN